MCVFALDIWGAKKPPSFKEGVFPLKVKYVCLQWKVHCVVYFTVVIYSICMLCFQIYLMCVHLVIR